MKPRLFVLSVLILISICVAVSGLGQFPKITGSGILTTKQVNNKYFSKIHAGSSFHVTVTQSRTYSVSITADRNVMELVRVTQKGDLLDLRLEPGFIFSRITLEADIKMPDIESVDLSGAAEGWIEGFDLPHNVSFSLSGASELEAEISARNLSLSLTGASSLRFVGRANNIVIDASGSSTLDLEDFPVRDADIDLSGACSVTVNLSGRLKCKLSGASKLYYVGKVLVDLEDISLSGASKIMRID